MIYGSIQGTLSVVQLTNKYFKSMQIRSATLKDDATISKLICRLTRRYISKDCTPAGAKRLLHSMEAKHIQGYLNSGYRYYLAEIDHQLVGVIGFIAEPSQHQFHLYHLFVDDKFQKQGIARKLWLMALNNNNQPQQQMKVTLNSSLNALKFYQKLGFVADSSTVWKNGIPSIPMKLTIK